MRFTLETRTPVDLTRAEESLHAATLCHHAGLYNSSVSRAYYAMYQAAQVALEAIGLVRHEWTHGGLQATFATELIRRHKWYAPGLARDLNTMLDLRHTADYRASGVSERQATRALGRAHAFGSQIKERING